MLAAEAEATRIRAQSEKEARELLGQVWEHRHCAATDWGKQGEKSYAESLSSTPLGAQVSIFRALVRSE